MTTTVKKFSPQQETLFQTFTETNQNIVVAATAGCLGLGTKVLMFDKTQKRVESVRVGDVVMGPLSSPRNVVAVATGRSKLYQITPNIGRSWICNDKHMLTVVFVDELPYLLPEDGLFNDKLQINEILAKMEEVVVESLDNGQSRMYTTPFALVKHLDNDNLQIVRFKIEPLKIDKWYGFTVDGDHRFLLWDGTITHNSGKSTSLLHLLNLIPVYKKSVFVAFSNAIAAELKERVPKHSKASTFHSLGLGCIRKTFGFDSVVVSPNKVKDYVKERLAKQTFNNPKKWYKKWMDLVDIIEVCRLHHLTEIEQLLDKDLEFKMDIILEAFQLHMELLSSDQSKYPTKSDPLIVDFSAMVFMPALDPRIRVDKYDVVCVDECQDLTPITREFALKLIAPNGRFVAVGDKFQAIFGFMGSDAESFSKLEAIPNTITLPLSTTYRCGKQIAKFAQRFSPDIIPFEQNEDGEIYDGSILDAESGDIILCRTNKPLVKAYLEMLQEKVPCSIKDKDFGDKLMKIVKKYFDPLHPTQLRFALQKRAEEILQELQKLGVALPHAHPKYINFLELCEIVKLLVKAWGYKNLLADVEKMFNQSNGGATLMSIHKSKGLEADRVFIIRWDLCPHNRAVTSTEIEQEKHLQFVAVTRAKKELVFDHNAGRDDNVEEFIF